MNHTITTDLHSLTEANDKLIDLRVRIDHHARTNQRETVLLDYLILLKNAQLMYRIENPGYNDQVSKDQAREYCQHYVEKFKNVMV